MDLRTLANNLIDVQARRTSHLKGTLKQTANAAYAAGVRDLLKLMLDQAADSVLKEDLTAPLAIQAAHSAVPGEDAT